jgi:hypothetical protein
MLQQSHRKGPLISIVQEFCDVVILDEYPSRALFAGIPFRTMNLSGSVSRRYAEMTNSAKWPQPSLRGTAISRTWAVKTLSPV